MFTMNIVQSHKGIFCTFYMCCKDSVSPTIQTSYFPQEIVLTHLSAHVDRYSDNDDWDGDARNEGDDHRCSEQHAHLPQNLAGLRPWLLPPKRTS